MACDYCEIKDGKIEEVILYEDKEIIAFVNTLAYIPGQISIITREHYTILEQIPKQTFAKMSSIANKLAISLFDTLGAQGTNILIENGLGAGQKVPHFAMHILPRGDKDNISLEWKPQELEDFDLEDAMIQLSALTEDLKITDHDEKMIVAKSEDSKTEAVVKQKDKGTKKENYLIKSLRRKP